jgi:hypothetical protein
MNNIPCGSHKITASVPKGPVDVTAVDARRPAANRFENTYEALNAVKTKAHVDFRAP